MVYQNKALLYKNHMENFKKNFDVSRETFDKLKCYVDLLIEWQNKFNLVSKNSLAEVWTRHIADSAQLFQYFDKNTKNVYDFGSGAGFPALVLAIMAQEKIPEIKFTLVESITKKTLYLNTVKTVLHLDNVQIINDRVENLKLDNADIITARAMTSLNGLLKYAKLFSNKQTKLIFPKGKSFEQELSEAKNNWDFNLKICKNKFCDDGVILLLDGLRRKK